MRAAILGLAVAATVAVAAPPASADAYPTHCDEMSVNVLCLDQGNDGTIYQCVVWYYKIQPENNPTCFAIW